MFRVEEAFRVFGTYRVEVVGPSRLVVRGIGPTGILRVRPFRGGALPSLKD